MQQWRAPAFAVSADASESLLGATPRELLLRGFLVNATNPKGILFMLAVLPQFIDPAQPQAVQYAICGATLACTDLVVMSGYTVFAARVLRLLRKPHHIRVMNRTFGGLFVAAGAALATFKRGGVAPDAGTVVRQCSPTSARAARTPCRDPARVARRSRAARPRRR